MMCDRCGRELMDGTPCRCSKKKPVIKSQGLGDTIAKVTTAMGVKPCSKCKKRQEALNKAFPYKNKDEK